MNNPNNKYHYITFPALLLFFEISLWSLLKINIERSIYLKFMGGTLCFILLLYAVEWLKYYKMRRITKNSEDINTLFKSLMYSMLFLSFSILHITFHR